DKGKRRPEMPISADSRGVEPRKQRPEIYSELVAVGKIPAPDNYRIRRKRFRCLGVLKEVHGSIPGSTVGNVFRKQADAFIVQDAEFLTHSGASSSFRIPFMNPYS